MCRFALYLGHPVTLSSLLIEPPNSVIHQSFASSEQNSPVNGDGFGLAWYVPELSREPAVFKEVTPAWNNRNLLHLARVTQSPCVLAHVRAATPGMAVTRLNCHPFCWGPFAFAHNGHVAGYHRHRRRFLSRLSDWAFQLVAGTTDSEYMFALFASHYRRRRKGRDRLGAMAEALEATILEVEELRRGTGTPSPSQLNLVVTDSHHAVCSRFVSPGSEEAHSLYYCSGPHFGGGQSIGRISESAAGQAVIVASEPLSPEGDWVKVGTNRMLSVHLDRQIETKPLLCRGLAA